MCESQREEGDYLMADVWVTSRLNMMLNVSGMDTTEGPSQSSSLHWTTMQSLDIVDSAPKTALGHLLHLSQRITAVNGSHSELWRAK